MRIPDQTRRLQFNWLIMAAMSALMVWKGGEEISNIGFGMFLVLVAMIGIMFPSWKWSKHDPA